MSKLPTNLIKRRDTFYFRMQVNGQDKWISLGSEYRRALNAHRQLVNQYRSSRQQTQVEYRLEHSLQSNRIEPLLVDELAERWLREYVAARRDGKGQKLALQRYKDYIAPVVGKRKVKDLAPADLRRAQLKLSSQGLSVNSVRHILADFRCMLIYAERELRCIERAPLPARFLPKKPDEAPKRLTDAEVSKLLTAAKGDDSLAIRLALQTGLRWGELKALRWRHLQDSSLGPHLVLEKTKSKRVRRVYLSDELADELKSFRSETGDRLVFGNLPFSARPIVVRLSRATGVKWRFHQLRHTFASRWLEAGGSKEALRQTLGHSTIQLTELYGRVSEDYIAGESRTVAKAVAKAVAGSKTKAETDKQNRLEALDAQGDSKQYPRADSNGRPTV